MNEFFKWLSGNPVATIVLLVVIILTVNIYVVAFFQNREISLWPPKISPKAPQFRATVQIGEVNIPADSPQKRVFYDGTYKGIRVISVPVMFDDPFKKHVRVIASLQKIDLGDTNINRLLVRAENIRLTGFDMCFQTWEDSKVYDAAAAWIALGE
jgi:hypothetical protein